MKYHVQLDESTRVPMTAEAICDFWQSGKITYNTLVWKEGMADWVELRAVADELRLPKKALPTPRMIPIVKSIPPVNASDRLAERPAELPARRDEGNPGAALLILAGVAVMFASFFVFNDVQVINATTGSHEVSALKLQNRAFGAGTGALCVLIGTLMALLRRK